MPTTHAEPVAWLVFGGGGSAVATLPHLLALQQQTSWEAMQSLQTCTLCKGGGMVGEERGAPVTWVGSRAVGGTSVEGRQRVRKCSCVSVPALPSALGSISWSLGPL